MIGSTTPFISSNTGVTVGALVFELEPIISVPPSTFKSVSAGVKKSSLYLDGITKEVSYCIEKVRSSI